ncbi:MAG: hypothetical protein V4622_03785 [Bacteroidota bacterium]
MKNFTLLIFLSLIFTSCIEINDFISINSDGSGTFKYTVNLSSSKLKVNSVLALDSLDGKKVPSIAEIKEIIAEYKGKLEQKEGISNVKVESDFTNFILRFQCDFKNVQDLQNAIREIAIEKDKKQEYKEIQQTWLSWDGTKLTRSVPTLTAETTKRLKKEDADALKTGKYTSVTSFDRIIEKCENSNAVLSKNAMACMIKTNPYALIENMKVLENTIHLTNTKKQ